MFTLCNKVLKVAVWFGVVAKNVNHYKKNKRHGRFSEGAGWFAKDAKTDTNNQLFIFLGGGGRHELHNQCQLTILHAEQKHNDTKTSNQLFTKHI